MKTTAAQTAGYFSAFFILGAVIASLGPTLPSLAANTGVGLEAAGLLFTMRSLGYLLGSLLSGRLYDRLWGHRLQGFALLLAAGSMTAVPHLRHFWLLLGVMLLVGLAEGAIDVGANTQLAWVHRERSGPYLSGMFLVAGVGGFIAPLYIAAAGLEWGYLGIALLNLPAALWLLRTESPRPQQHSSRSGVMPVGIFLAFCTLAFLYIGSEVSMGGWMYTYFLGSGLADAASAARLNAFYWLGITLGRLASIALVRRIEAGRLILVFMVGVLLNLGVMVLLPGSALAAWVGVIGVGFFLASIFPLSFAYFERQAPLTGSKAGLLWASGSFGAMILPWWSGLSIERQGPASLLTLQVVFWGLALALFTGVNLRSRRRSS